MCASVNVIGCGGHAKVILRALVKAGHSINAIYDDNPAAWRTSLMGVPIVGPVVQILEDSKLPTVLAIGDNRTRYALAAKLDIEWFTVIAPQAIVDESAHIGQGTMILPGAIVQVDSQLGDHVIVNTGATIDHDCRVANFTHVAPGVNLGGNVVIGEGAWIGLGAAVLPGTIIGKWSVVGGGAVVVRDVPEGVVEVGVPARYLKNADRLPN